MIIDESDGGMKRVHVHVCVVCVFVWRKSEIHVYLLVEGDH